MGRVCFGGAVIVLYDDDEWQRKLDETRMVPQLFSYEREGKHPSPIVREGWKRLRTGNYAEAEQILRKSLAEDGSYSSAWQYFGEALEELERYEEAEEALKKAIECDPFNKEAMTILFNMLTRLEKWSDVIAVGLQVVNVDPGSPLVWETLSIVYSKLGDDEKSSVCRSRSDKLVEMTLRGLGRS